MFMSLSWWYSVNHGASPESQRVIQATFNDKPTLLQLIIGDQGSFRAFQLIFPVALDNLRNGVLGFPHVPITR